jgi:hypothetical protein
VTCNEYTVFFLLNREASRSDWIFGGSNPNTNQNLLRLEQFSERTTGLWGNDVGRDLMRFLNLVQIILPEPYRIWTLQWGYNGYRNVFLNGQNVMTNPSRSVNLGLV